MSASIAFGRIATKQFLNAGLSATTRLCTTTLFQHFPNLMDHRYHSPDRRRPQIQQLCVAHPPLNTLCFATSGTSGLDLVGYPSLVSSYSPAASLYHAVSHGDFPSGPVLYIYSCIPHNDFGCVADTKNYFRRGMPCVFHALRQNPYHLYRRNVSTQY
jgi:hypothetical protein